MTNTSVVPNSEIQVEFPFRIHTVFFSQINIKRSPLVIDGPEINIHAETRLSKRDEPNNYQLDFRICSNREEDCPVALEFEVIAIFESTTPGLNDADLLMGFINQRLLFVVASMVSNFLSQLTSQMGMAPIRLPLPLAFGFHKDLIPDGFWDDDTEIDISN